MKSLSLIAALLLTSCAHNADGWDVEKRVDALPAVFVPSTAAEIQAQCPQVRGAMGCAVRDWNARVCRIYVEVPPAPWIAMHELWHCAGWSHHG
jgi:hypothetical protein